MIHHRTLSFISKVVAFAVALACASGWSAGFASQATNDGPDQRFPQSFLSADRSSPVPAQNVNVGPGPSMSDTVRFLEQSTFGPTPDLITHVRTIGFQAYLDEQFAAPMSEYPRLPMVNTIIEVTCPPGSASTCVRDNYTMYPLQSRFFRNALYGPDQLRQRVAFALSQIFVCSGVGSHPSRMAPYLKMLNQRAFGNFRDLLHEVTLNRAMGKYLDMYISTKLNPNENYARELLQLFSLGLYKLNWDGTLQLDQQGNPIPTYNQNTITNFARVFTGWTIPQIPGQPNVYDFKVPMVVVNINDHDTGLKVLLNGTVLPANQTPSQDLEAALDNIFNHQNVGAFICKQLIQHLVTSNPSSAYIRRVVGVFNDNGSHVRGDLKAVVKAILLDTEARGDVKTDPNYGHLREPVLYITNVLRLFGAKSFDKTTTSDGYLAPYSTSMGEDLFLSPTVFNYFAPNYVIPASSGLIGPEFQIMSNSVALKRANFVDMMLYTGIQNSPDPVTGNAPRGTSLDLASMAAIASDPKQLTANLNSLMLHGTMTTAMRDTIVQALSSVPTSDPQYRLKRAQMAIYLVATSPQYQVER